MSQEQNAAVLANEHFRALSKYFRDHPIALYTGAGVSRANDPKYGLSNWDGFVRDILVDCEGPNSKTVVKFDQQAKGALADKPWELAEWVAKRIGRKSFEQCVVKIVQRDDNFPTRRQSQSKNKKEYKQLGGPFLRHAPTLNAVCAFCAHLIASVKGTKSSIYRIGLNPRVRAVLTSNYDCFLEAASSTMYIRPRLKPVGAWGSSIGRADQIPVFHIHGYVPYPKTDQAAGRTTLVPMVDPVVTTGDYDKAWRTDDPFCFTMAPQIHVLRHSCTLFVGFSFRDPWVNRLLEKLNTEREGRGSERLYHYAVMSKSAVKAKGTRFFDRHGVRPVALDNYGQIPLFFERLYAEGLRHDYHDGPIPLPVVEKTRGTKRDRDTSDSSRESQPVTKSQPLKHLTVEDYWNHLYRCRNCSVRQ